MNRHLFLVCLLLGLLGDLPCRPVVHAAGTEPNTESRDDGASALVSDVRFPWYDVDAARLRPIPVAPTPPLPGSPDWVERERSKNAKATNDSWNAVWKLIQYAVWLTLGVLLIWLTVYGIRMIMRDPLASATDAAASHDREPYEVDSIEELPFQVARPQADLLNEARRHYAAKDYRTAIVYLFSYQLVQLDRHQLIQLAKGKTNRQYLNELRSADTLREMLTQTMVAFEDVFFGHYGLNKERFEACWARVDEFERLTRETSTATR